MYARLSEPTEDLLGSQNRMIWVILSPQIRFLSRIFINTLAKKTQFFMIFSEKGGFATEYFTFRKLCYLVAIFRPKKRTSPRQIWHNLIRG
jgi:kynureninase